MHRLMTTPDQLPPTRPPEEDPATLQLVIGGLVGMLRDSGEDVAVQTTGPETEITVGDGPEDQVQAIAS